MKFLIILLVFFLSCCTSERVYNPYRLLLLEPNKTVRGYVKKVSHEFDGDAHIRLKITDLSLLTKRNFKDEDSCLILEIVCVEKSIMTLGSNYKNCLRIPKVGELIEVSGPYVFDKVHGINEIHPVEHIRIL